MGDDVQLAVVALVEEPAAPALLPAQGVAAVQGEEDAGADTAGANEGAVVEAQGPSSNAALAAATARLTSAAFESGTWAMISSLAGS